uniref:Neuralized-like protein 4-like n=1 Tax=Saccoglossus kowalevskii TaxID=10224 RepID=A0ABM0MJC5_SACKO
MEYDTCYCVHCHGVRGDAMYYERGIPSKVYALPIGWVRFPLKVRNAYPQYHVAYHGTKSENLKDILLTHRLLIPGDTTPSGKIVNERKFHIPACNQFGFNTKQIFVSPSILYAGNPTYATPKKWYDCISRWVYNASVAIQVWIRPFSYKVGRHTLAGAYGIDPFFSDDTLEWSTTNRWDVIPYGLL